MLVSFSVENFRSISERQTISMVPSVGAKRNKYFSFPTDNSFAPYLLRSSCLFGSNGSGKSSLVDAFDLFKHIVISSAKDTQRGELINVTPFKFDSRWKDAPTEFEIIFIHQGVVYQYGFASDKYRIWSEWLFSKPKEQDTKNRKLFEREFDEENSKYYWNVSKKYVKGEKELWKNMTRDNALFLSTAMQLNSTAFRSIFTWIQSSLCVIRSPERLSPRFTAQQCSKTERHARILNLFQAVDARVLSMKVDKQNLLQRDVFSGIWMTEPVGEELRRQVKGKKTFEIAFFHRGKDGDLVEVNFQEESTGNQVIFNLAGPWLDVLDNGHTLIVDDLHNSLHPNVLKYLIQLFHDPEVNSNNAQLIFTSHETSVMAKGFMHQDQIWILDKGEAESSMLVPLSDYKVRDISTFQRAYLDGRFGGVPKLRELANR